MILALILLAHGWYDTRCCGEGDCRPVPCAEIVRSDDRWLWRGIKPIIGALPSQDGQCHACPHYDRDWNRTFLFCIYLPKVTS